MEVDEEVGGHPLLALLCGEHEGGLGEGGDGEWLNQCLAVLLDIEVEGVVLYGVLVGLSLAVGGHDEGAVGVDGEEGA